MSSSAPGPTRPDGLWLNDLSVGQTFRSDDYSLTESEIVEFASRYDPQLFHVDPERARDTFFGGLASSGWLTAAVTMRLFTESVPLACGVIGSTITLAWPTATRPGDRLRAESRIDEITPSSSRPDRAAVLFSYRTLTADDEIRQQTSGRVLSWNRPTDA
ncbi:MaoC/PaaZ C-terminal domain-containing protein [Cryptosporangium phraense]|uniref:Dehydratase n=1 Tax=Cryptosporangium phraense TaxID=2593070 RepID=A0A545AS00_9ACTN|nr:MaoC/PaaZ C-terminal domain-containing protein [Cryptosporangium phraense]TQS44094.1 dehydratase [Cryptosporangium phraense]